MPETQLEPEQQQRGAAEARLPAALEPRLYLDPDVVELEQRRIFERTWQLAGHVSDLPAGGSYITVAVGTQPVLVVRDADGALRAFRNVCRHRGSRLLSGRGSCGKALRCRYHGWTYRLDGSLIGVPEGRAIPGLDKAALGLMPVRVEEFCGLVWVNLDGGAEPIGELLAELRPRLERYRLASLRRFGEGSGGGVQPANWKVVADNYLEGYHIPIAHPGLMRLLDYAGYEAEVHADWVWIEAPMRLKPSANRFERLYQRLVQPMPGLGESDRRVWRYVYIYPNTTIDLYPDQVNTWRLWPDGPNRTRDEWGNFGAAAPPLATRVAQRINVRLNNRVLDEDIDLVDNVQQGLATRDYACGPLSNRENAVAWFAERVRADLARPGA